MRTVPPPEPRAVTMSGMLDEVDRAWHRPPPLAGAAAGTAPDTGSPLRRKLDALVVPEFECNGLDLARVVAALNAIAADLDAAEEGVRGLNLVLLDPAGANPRVTLTLRHLPLGRILDLVAESVGYRYEVQADAVVFRPGDAAAALETRFFPLSRATVLRLTGRTAGDPAPARAEALAGSPRERVTAADSSSAAIRTFLQLAGVGFDAVPGSSLAFDGSQLIVTHTPRELDRIHNILARYAEIRQVAIEAKFMEVQDGALEELGLNWSVASRTGNGGWTATAQSANRTVADAFTNQGNNRQGRIVGGESGLDQAIANSPPVIPGTNNLGVNTPPLASVGGVLGEFNVNAVLRALAQRSGTELLSAPKLLVLSGNPATITVAQELRYPQSYGQVQSQVGTGSASGGGSAGVAITAGTPQDFTTRNIGVELRVTPTVEEDGRSISLDLNPKVTEFEGFVEYGGQSIAIAGNPATTVTIPSGFYQPIFGVRELATRVTVWDGATLVMGGLTREDVKKTADKVPVIGNVPVLGRLFRTRGESTQKRNLLIFVTANLVNPGGGLRHAKAEAGVPD